MMIEYIVIPLMVVTLFVSGVIYFSWVRRFLAQRDAVDSVMGPWFIEFAVGAVRCARILSRERKAPWFVWLFSASLLGFWATLLGLICYHFAIT